MNDLVVSDPLPGLAPHSLEAERAVLGAILLEPAILPAIERLTADEFYKDAHRIIYGAMLRLFERSEPADMLTVTEELRRAGMLEEVGGQAALATLVEEATVATQFKAYLSIIVEYAQRRAIARACEAARDAALNSGRPAAILEALRRELPAADVIEDGGPSYRESVAEFLAEEDPPVNVVFPELLPTGVIMLLHGEPRSRKSLAAFELALAAATGTAPFGLDRFRPAGPIGVLYIQEEDPRSLTRPRLRRLVAERCGADPPATLYVSVRRGVDLDDPGWEARLIVDLRRLNVGLLVLDAARRFSAKTDEGPAKVREFTAVLRRIITATGVALIIVHHDVKPARDGQDLRRRSQRASGADWFAVAECPVHVERLSETDTLVYPQDYKFASDPSPFTFRCELDGRLIAALIGRDTTSQHAETAGTRGKVLAWLRANGPATRTAIRKAGFAWETVESLLDELMRSGDVDAHPGRRKDSLVYFATNAGDGSWNGDGS